MPRRIQRKRTKGWKAPEGTVYVGRGSRWGNPFRITKEHDAASCVRSFEVYVRSYLSNGIGYPINQLRGKDLMCWCKEGSPCHGDVLLKMANEQIPIDTAQHKAQQ